ncbi:L-aminopeptidase/D-esterase-like protein [Knoellia remsis]|uniref:L-aminopeptidase/D-esterase-like protein n=1 Tax=Knoellia remsis TaxID=407159 RepID=A0A2T0U500_9MICO|nr:P1 family peptidase [Knoellia remsis]PRY52918.1 L-aminopeptidase/D-esterase-like protein [Knoellia remsis]
MDAPTPGRLNAITDVAGVRVGQVTRDEPGWLTGVTVVVPPEGTVGGVCVAGGAPGTRETDLLDPTKLVDRVDAVVLTGGSAFGLATADGVMQESYAAGRGWPVGSPESPGQVVPIVPAAVVFDLGRGGVFENTPTADDGARAWREATDGPVAQGSVGAGTGAAAGGLKGGVGTASAVGGGVTVGALVVVNAMGSPCAPDGSLYAVRSGLAGEFDDVPTPDPAAAQAYWEQRAAETEALRAGTATTIAVVATDAALTKTQCRALAEVSQDGLARALSPVHTAYDGDTVFTLATGARSTPEGVDLVALQTAAADCLTRAIGHAMLAATSVDRTGDGGVTLRSWRATMVDR